MVRVGGTLCQSRTLVTASTTLSFLLAGVYEALFRCRRHGDDDAREVLSGVVSPCCSQNWARSESCRFRSPPPTPPPFVSTLPKVKVLFGFRPMLVVPLQPLPPHQFGWLKTLKASARN